MRIAVIFNRNSQEVINLFGIPNREKYGQENIKRIVNALKKGNHQVISLEGDKALIKKVAREILPSPALYAAMARCQ